MLSNYYLIIKKIRSLEQKFKPDDNVEIKMNELTEIADSIKSLSHIIEMDCYWWAEEHTHIERKYIEMFGMPSECMSIPQMFDAIINKLQNKGI